MPKNKIMTVIKVVLALPLCVLIVCFFSWMIGHAFSVAIHGGRIMGKFGQWHDIPPNVWYGWVYFMLNTMIAVPIICIVSIPMIRAALELVFELIMLFLSLLKMLVCFFVVAVGAVLLLPLRIYGGMKQAPEIMKEKLRNLNWTKRCPVCSSKLHIIPTSGRYECMNCYYNCEGPR